MVLGRPLGRLTLRVGIPRTVCAPAGRACDRKALCLAVSRKPPPAQRLETAAHSTNVRILLEAAAAY